MSQGQEIPHCTQEQHHVLSEPQGLEAAQVSRALEETSPSFFHTLMLAYLNEALAAGAPSTPHIPQSAYSCYTVITTISSSKSDEVSSSQKRETGSASSKSLSETENLPTDPLDEKVIFLVQFLVQKYQMRDLITKADMIDDVIREYKDDFLEILRRASECIWY